jgi:uncharacterized membrane protein YeaQ/YmgE (transglycosylase-associated protein family)
MVGLILCATFGDGDARFPPVRSKAVAQFLMPGKDPGQDGTLRGFAITTLLGIAGAVLGGFVSSQLFNWDVTGFNLPSFIIAIAGALGLLVLYRLLMSAGRSA